MPEENITPYTQDSLSNYPELSATPIDRRPIIIGIVVALGILVIFVGTGWWLFVHPVATAVLRDIFVIYLGLGLFLIILLLIALIVAIYYLVVKVNDLVQLLNREVRPVLSNLQGTAQNVSGTTRFYSDKAVKPVIATAGYLAAVRAIFRSLFQRH
jgi:hypothetical protein